MRRIPGVGVIGAGFIGRVHARSAKLAGGRLVGVVGSSPDRTRELAAEFGTDPAVSSAEDLISHPEVDVVHICTPNYLHVPLAEAALRAGKHVVCEKPLAVEAAGAARLVRLADEAGLVAAVPFVYRFYPTVREARARAERGDLGSVRLIHGSYLQDWLMEAGDYNWRVDAGFGGASRAFADIGSHWCDLVEFVTGQRITRLVARSSTVLGERRRNAGIPAFGAGGDGGASVAVDTEDVAGVLFETDGGAVGTVMVSQVSPGRKNRLWFEVDGSAGAVAFDQEWPETLWVGGREANALVARGSPANSEGSRRFDRLPAGHPQGYLDCFEAFVGDTYRAIAGEEPEGLPRFADGRRSVHITEAVLASARSGEWREVEPCGAP
ncbi:MAG: Gfo/Idh/MocA family oxidoreductase [Acidimicrobiia bacterium]|nr:Gfo/Idh/MocA family oxidoreductase [Acidimicrobiia bacterium]